MDKSVRRRVLGQLAAVMVAGAAGFAEPAASLRGIPEEIIIDLVDDPENEGVVRSGLLTLLAADPRARVRERVAGAAAAVGQRSLDDAQALVQRLCSDDSARVRVAAAQSLAAVLAAAPPLARPEIVSLWALSQRTAERAAVARALRRPIAVFVSDLALAELSNDVDPEVRALAARAMARRIHEAPESYGRELQRLRGDPHPRVARTARRLLDSLARPKSYA